MSIEPLAPVAAPDATHTAFAKERGTWLDFVKREWALALLAITLAVVIYNIGRGEISSTGVIDQVQVIVDYGDRQDTAAFLAEGQNTITLEMDCTSREHERAVAALVDADGKRRIYLRIGRTPASDSAFREFDPSDRLVLPFPGTWLVKDSLRDSRAAVKGWVYRTREMEVRVQPPAPLEILALKQASTEKKGIEATLSIEEDPLVTLMMVDELENGPGKAVAILSPDLVDLTSYLDPPPRDGQVVRGKTPLRFDEWRKGPNKEALRRFRAKMVLPELTWKARFIVPEDARLASNVFVYLVAEPERFTFRIDGRRGLGMREVRDVLEASLLAPRSERDRLVASGEQNASGNSNVSGWVWAVAFDGDLPASAEEGRKEVKAHIQVLVLDPNLRGEAIRVHPTNAQRSFYVQVERR